MKNKLLILLILLVLLAPTNLFGGTFGNRAKHFSVAAAISGGLTAFCKTVVSRDDNWGCFLFGVIPTIIGAAYFEALQNDLTDMEGDMLMGISGGAFGSILVISLDIL